LIFRESLGHPTLAPESFRRLPLLFVWA
jgi:hypothetical protein